MGTRHTNLATNSADALAALRAASANEQAAVVELAQALIRIPSMSGEEQEIASFVADWMKDAGYDDVWIDAAGNAVGVLRGNGDGSSVQFNSHLDHVDVGDPTLWPYPPFEAVIEADVLYGRGASDIKGAMACQLGVVPILKAAGLQPAADIIIAAVVLEEVGGLGSAHLAAQTPTDIAVLGESTNNQIARGHRGRVFVEVTFRGLSAHASAPDRARNPHFACAHFLLALEQLPMLTTETFGHATVAPTLIATDQSSGNVTPAEVTVYLDWRSLPEEDEDGIIERVAQLAVQAAATCIGIETQVTVAGRPVRSYTGIESVMPSTRGYELPANDPVVQVAERALVLALQRPVDVGTWTFATDGGHLAAAGIRTIGFGPGEEQYAHTIWDQISLANMSGAVFGNAVLALELSALPKANS